MFYGELSYEEELQILLTAVLYNIRYTKENISKT